MTDGGMLDLAMEAIGSALLHSLWQGALIAAAVAALLHMLGRASANVRYLVACAGLAAMAASWVGTASSAAQTLAARATIASAGATTPIRAALGPAGPDDRSAAIRILPSERALDPGNTVPWRTRVEAWSVTAVPVWLVGVLVLSMRLFAGWVVVERLRRRALTPVDAYLTRQVATLARRMRLRRVIHVTQSAAVHVPTVVGWLRPVVLLPACALTSLTPEQLEAVIAHELAHVRRHDYLVNVLQSAVEILLFYHPACWWLSRRIRAEREHCCDDVAVGVCGDRVAYASALADLESLRADSPLALAATDGPLLQRVRRVIGADERAAHERPGLALAAAPLVALLLIVLGAQAASSDSSPAFPQTSTPTPGRTIPADEGVVQGRVVEASSGRAVEGATVLVVGSGADAVTTNADGRYEVSRLKPGSYRVSVRMRGYVEGHYGLPGAPARQMEFGAQVDVRGGTAVTGIDVRLQRAGSVVGRVTDAEGKGLAAVEVELVEHLSFTGEQALGALAFAQTDDEGAYRMSDIRPGDYFVRAYATREARTGVTGNAALAYAPTFYPGVPKVDEAQRLRVDAGQELLDVDFPLSVTRRFRVSGTVVDPTGELPGDTRVVLHRIGASGGPSAEQSSGVDKVGRFEIRDVVPDTYMVNVFDRRTTSRWVAATGTLSIDADVVDLEIRAALGAQVEGRIVADGGSARALDSSQVTIGFEKAMPGPWGGVTMGGNRIVQDGRFSMESPGGPVRFKVIDVPAGWMVKSIALDGTDIDDAPIDFGSGRRHMEIVLTDKVSGIAGIVTDRTGRALPNHSVVVFPPDRTRWHSSSRFIISARSDNTGRFRLDAVPPGDYLAVAVPGLPMNAWQRHEVLERLQTGAERVRIGEGQRLTISIRATAMPDGLGASVAPLDAPGQPRAVGPVLGEAPWASAVRATQDALRRMADTVRGIVDAGQSTYSGTSRSPAAITHASGPGASR